MQDRIFFMNVRIDEKAFNKLLLDIVERVFFEQTYFQDEFEHHQLVRHNNQHKVI